MDKIKFELYDEDEQEAIKELEKLSDHHLMARLIFELNKLNQLYEYHHIPYDQEMSEYFDYLDNTKNGEITYSEYQNLKRQLQREESIKLNNQIVEDRNKLNKNFTQMSNDVDKYNAEQHKTALENATKIILANFDWNNLPKKPDIKLQILSLGLTYKFKQKIYGDDLYKYKSINDCPTKEKPIPYTELQVCFYNASKKAR